MSMDRIVLENSRPTTAVGVRTPTYNSRYPMRNSESNYSNFLLLDLLKRERGKSQERERLQERKITRERERNYKR